jgi:chromosome condensin MukBEF complex kleisin-like MukF subunit
LHAENQICFDKLKKHLPEHSDIIDQANYLDDEKMQYLRKKILDIGNESMREANSNIEKFTVNFKF